MKNPMITSLKAQSAAFQCAVSVGQTLTDTYLRMLHQHNHLWHGHLMRRAEDMHRHPFYIATGADLMDHYGRRHHDVDIEHI